MDKKLFFFLHIHKTAGTSFRSWLTQQFPNKTLLDAHRCHRFDQIKATTNWESIRLVWGHLGYATVNELPEKPFLMTFFRDPVDRVLSHYDHIRNDPITVSFDMLDRMPLPEILEKHGAFFSNLQTRNIAQRQLSRAFYLEHDPPFLHQHKNQLELAKQRLQDEFDFIGFTEKYDFSLKRLCAITGWSPTVYHQNVSTNRRKQNDYPASVIDKIIELNQDDIALYEYAKELVLGA
jgi:hypothetical protein